MTDPIYIAGPMSGYDDWNFPAFHAAAKDLRERGYSVVNPAELDEEDEKKPGERPWAWYLRRDLKILLDCNTVWVLAGWEQSRGASLEVYVARALGIPVEGYVSAQPSTALPTDSRERKNVPLVRGVLDYFPAALAEVARLSDAGNRKHNPGQPLHWSREKSSDHADCIVRHLVERGTRDTDGFLHDVKVAWRGLALLQVALEEQGAPMARGARDVQDLYVDIAAG